MDSAAQGAPSPPPEGGRADPLEAPADLLGGRSELLLGVVHLRPLPGSPRFRSRAEVREWALRDADAILEGGLDGFVLENFGDAPFFADCVPPSTVAEMAVLAQELRTRAGGGAVLGINVLRNDSRAALSVAAAAGADFVRINVHCGAMWTDQGLITGRAAETLRLRRSLETRVAVVADVAVKHAQPPAGFDLAQAARDTARRGMADALIITGEGTGEPVEQGDLRAVREVVPRLPILVGSGVSQATVRAGLTHASGVIVGTDIKESGEVTAPVDARRVASLVAAVRG